MNPSEKIKVVFVCLGNICRSPMAEAVFQNLVNEAGLADRFEISSGGTGGWHAGERPHKGTQLVLQKMKVPLDPEKKAQKVAFTNLSNADYVIAMDRENLANLKSAGINARLLLDYCKNGHPQDVPDPYYRDNFEEVFSLVLDGCSCLLNQIRIQAGV